MNERVPTENEDFWVKVVDMLQRNWAVIEPETAGRVRVYFIEDVSQLCDRLDERAKSRLMAATPELQHDLRVAVIVLRRAVMIGFPVRPIEIENGREVPVPVLPVAPRLVTVPAGSRRPTMLRRVTMLVIDEDSVPITQDMAATIVRTVRAAAGG